jgi:hypothetical protein
VLSTNYGFINGKAVQIDWGMIHKSEAIKNHPQEEYERVVQKVASRLEVHQPEIKPYIEELKTCPPLQDCCGP